MREKIEAALQDVAQQHDVRVLFACESGSRAWGFASVDSDYDVRFVYLHTLDDYLTVRSRRDVIEEMLPDDIDLAGWDLRKALSLMAKSNPSLYEWLRSPIVYAADSAFMDEFQALADRWYSELRLFLHYLHMAQGNWRTYLQGDSVSRKKYLYVLRPTLACLWIEQGRGVVPMEFERLRATADDPALQTAIETLLVQKMAGAELAMGPPDPVLQAFLDRELSRLNEVRPAEPPRPDPAELDQFLRRWVLADH